MNPSSSANRWSVKSLEQVLVTLPIGKKVQQGWSPQCENHPATTNDQWGVLKTTAIQPGQFRGEHNKALPTHLEPREGLEVLAGDLLLTNAGPRARCAVPCLVRTTRPKLMLSGKTYRFRADESVMDPRFLEMYLLSAEAQAALDQMKTGISDSGLNLTTGRFLELQVPVPPLPQQGRIVEILDDHCSRLAAAIQGLTAANHRLRGLIATQIETTKRAAATESCSARLSDLAVDAGYGTSTKCVVGGPGAVVVRIPNLVAGGVDLSDQKRVQDPTLDVTSVMLQPDDLLIVRTNGSRNLIGRTAVVPPGITAAFASYLIRYRLDSTRVRPAWVHLMMQAPSTRAILESMAASSAGQYNLGLRKLDRVAIPVPDLAEQDRLLSTCTSVIDGATRTAESVKQAVDRGALLRRAVMFAALSGQLTSLPGVLPESAHV